MNILYWKVIYCDDYGKYEVIYYTNPGIPTDDEHTVIAYYDDGTTAVI